MKVCPKCQASFAEGFVYCPRDAELLVRYDLRAHWRTSATDEFKFLLTPESLWRRLARELRAAWQELRRDPRRYLAALLRGEGSSRRRKQMLQAGVALAVIGYTLVVTALLLLGLLRSTTAEQVVIENPMPKPRDPESLKMIALVSRAKNEFERGRNGHLGGSLVQPRRAHGGGGGGQPEAAPASGGHLPRASLLMQQIIPDPALPKIEQPSLIRVPTIVADPLAVKFVGGQIGLPEAPPAPPSKGQGARGGIGNNVGTGVGPGEGPGHGPGNDGNVGGGRFDIGGRDTTGIGNRNGLPRAATAHLRPTILFKEKAKYTEEARQIKIQGTVVLVATFNANGQISDIRVMRGLPGGLTEEAIQAAKRIRFQPAMENGVPVAVRTQLEYNFALY
jgi:TonB family protein